MKHASWPNASADPPVDLRSMAPFRTFHVKHDDKWRFGKPERGGTRRDSSGFSEPFAVKFKRSRMPRSTVEDGAWGLHGDSVHTSHRVPPNAEKRDLACAGHRGRGRSPRYGCRSLLTDSDSSQSVLRAQVQAQPRRAPAQSERSMRAGGGSTQELSPQVRRHSILQGPGEGRANALMRAASRRAVRVVEGSTAISLP